MKIQLRNWKQLLLVVLENVEEGCIFKVKESSLRKGEEKNESWVVNWSAHY